MSDLTIWHDTQRDRWYVQHKHQLEEILPLTLEYMKDMQSEIEKLREQSERLFDKTLELATENARLRELVRDYYRFAEAMCAERDCDGCSQRDEGACERGVLTSRECVLGVEVE